jgi:hypothetical protein
MGSAGRIAFITMLGLRAGLLRLDWAVVNQREASLFYFGQWLPWAYVVSKD